MTSLPAIRVRPLSPSQPSPVGASAFARQGPTRSGCGLGGAHPLSPNPEVPRPDLRVDNFGIRQRSRGGFRLNTMSGTRFALFRFVSTSDPKDKPPLQYYGGQNAIRHKPVSAQVETSRHHERQNLVDRTHTCSDITCDIASDGYTDSMKEKAKCQLRLEPAVHERLKALAKRSDLSLNQLAEGILAWAGTNAHTGIPQPRGDELTIESSPASHVVWFGHDGTVRDRKGKIVDIDGPGQICFLLDFRATRAMVDGREVEDVK